MAWRIRREIVPRAGGDAFCTDRVPYTQVVQGDRRLDESLIEVAVVAPVAHPEFLQNLVRLEELALVKRRHELGKNGVAIGRLSGRHRAEFYGTRVESRSMTRQRFQIVERLALPALYVLVVCAFFYPTLLGERFYASDFFQTFVPLRTILADAWTRGFPTWTGRLGNGSPVLANPAYAMLYLPNLLYLGTDAARSMTALTLAHFIGGGLGVFSLARRWDMSRAAAWTAAVGFVLSGPVVSSTAYPNLSWPLAWLPFAIVAYDEALRGRAWRGIAGLSIVGLSLLSMGETVVLAAAIVGCALMALLDVTRSPADRSRRARVVRSLVPAGAATLLSLILASPLLIAVARYFPFTVRASGFKAEAIVLWSLHPLLLAGVILPNPYGDPSLCGPAGFWASALAPDRGRPLLAGLYVGGLIVALAILGALRRSPHRITLLCWLGVLVALALGKYGPIYPFAGDANGFDAIRFPTKWIVPAMLPLALLAGSGLDQLRAGASAAGVKSWGAAVFLLVLALLAATSAGTMLGLDRKLATLAAHPDLGIGDLPIDLYARSTWLAAAARSAIPLALALLALLFLPRTRAVATVLPVIAALATFDVAVANRRLAPSVTSDFYDVPPAATVILEDPAGHERVFVDDADIDAHQLRCVPSSHASQDAARAQRAALASYVGAAAGLSLAFNSDTEAFSPLPYARASVLIRGAPLREKLMLLGAAGTTHIVTFRPPEEPLVDPIAAIPGAFGVPLLVYRNPFAVSRARIVPRLTPYDSDTGFIRAVQSAPDDLFRHTALVEQQALISTGMSPDSSAAEGGHAKIVAEDGRSLTLMTEGPGGFLIVSDTLVPGWTAKVDGQPAPIVPVDLAFRAVPVPPGDHRVEMSYNPW